MQRELYDELRVLAESARIPITQLVGQSARWMLQGLVPLRPARGAYELGLETFAMRAQRPQAGSSEPDPGLPGTCAVCGGDKRPVFATELDPGGPRYPICNRCNTEVVPDVPRQSRRHR